MKIILTRDVPKVGKDGEIVQVADGYARNYLFPRQLAVVAKGAAMKQHSARISREVEKTVHLLAEAHQNAEKLTGKELQLLAKASPRSTRLFGSITSADMANEIQRLTGVVVDKRKISLVDPIKVTGRYELTVKLHPDVVVPFSIDVVTQEQIEARERARVAAEEKAAREAAAAQAKADADEAAAKARAEAAEARALAQAAAVERGEAPEKPDRPERRERRERFNYADIPDAEG